MGWLREVQKNYSDMTQNQTVKVKIMIGFKKSKTVFLILFSNIFLDDQFLIFF